MNAHARWNRKWRRLYAERYEENGRRHQDAFDYAWEQMRRQDGEQPPEPPSLSGIGFRILWLTMVKGMDWKKLGMGALGAFLVGAVAIAGPAMSDGSFTKPELLAAVAAGVGALGLYLRDPNAHKGQDPRQAPGLRNVLKK